jgi:predicted nucleic acid-binding protein
MAIIADTSGILALLDRDEHYHTATVQAVGNSPLWIPSTVLPEVDYLATKYLDDRVARSFLDAVVSGYFTYITVELPDIERALHIMQQYEGVPLGLVDSSVVAIAERYQIQQILTLDRRHFSLIQPQGLPHLELLP